VLGADEVYQLSEVVVALDQSVYAQKYTLKVLAKCSVRRGVSKVSRVRSGVRVRDGVRVALRWCAEHLAENDNPETCRTY